ncbi:MAG: diguanylate cyclase [Chloroflexi bacterium]|nr:diguanylate cyclase [Chloroflexota bacterium]
MKRSAWFYVFAVMVAGSALVWPSFGTPVNGADLMPFVALVTMTTAAQMFKVVAGRQTYYATLIFIAISLVVLPVNLLALTIIIAYLVEWIKERLTNANELRNWYIQPFNIAAHLISALAAREGFLLLRAALAVSGWQSMLAPFALAAIAYVVFNHLLIGGAIWFARGLSLRASGVLEGWNLAGDLLLLTLGFMLSSVWATDPWLIAAALGILPLLYRALQVPELQKEASIDSKTGLFNAKYFMKAFTEELDKSQRYGRPLTILMADLDLLRNVNNTYGHLAGDAVLADIGKIIRQTARQCDLAGRFGGEEFAIVLPETTEPGAKALADRLRRAVEEANFQIPTSVDPIHVTLSIGAANFPADGQNAISLIHEADIAVYQAKLQGRNCVVFGADVPHSLQLQFPGQAERAHSFVRFNPRPVPAMAQPPAAGAPAPSAPLPSGDAAPSSASVPARNVIPSQAPFGLFVAGVITVAAALSLLGFALHAPVDVIVVGLLALLALATEVSHIDLYGDAAISVSFVANFAAALLGGLPAVALVSAAIAIGDRIALAREGRFVLRTALYKAPFNWAVHVLAGALPALAMLLLNETNQADNLFLLMTVCIFAAIGYFLVETGLIAAVMGLTTGQPSRTIWLERHRWLLPHYGVLGALGVILFLFWGWFGPLSIVAFALPLFLLRYTQKQYVDRTSASIRELKRMNAELSRANHEVKSASAAIRTLNSELFVTLSKIIDARDPYVAGHAGKVADYALAVGSTMGLEAERLERLREAAFLHDIGKLAISEQILQKPGRLTSEEYTVIKTHAAIGADLLDTSASLRLLSPFVRAHHERWDGNGYPDGLRGQQIPLEARILVLCDAVEAMASDRPYHRAMSAEEILAELRRCRGGHFDPQVVDTFLRVVEAHPEQIIVNIASDMMRAQPEPA